MRNLRELPVGTEDGGFELVEKKRNGEYQLWRSLTTGRFGVCRIVNNNYVVLVECRADENIARLVFALAGENVAPF